MTRLKRGLQWAGCGLLWLGTAWSTFLEWLIVSLLLDHEQELARFGREENPYIVERAETLSIFAFLNLFPLLLLLALSIFCTYKLRRKKGTPCTPNN